MKETIKQHWPSAVIVTILLAMTGYFSVGKFDAFDKADSRCVSLIERTAERVTGLDNRLIAIETNQPYMLKALNKNTTAIEKMADNVQEIKILIISNMERSDKDNGSLE